jgi:hypothetical protein
MHIDNQSPEIKMLAAIQGVVPNCRACRFYPQELTRDWCMKHVDDPDPSLITYEQSCEYWKPQP